MGVNVIVSCGDVEKQLLRQKRKKNMIMEIIKTVIISILFTLLSSDMVSQFMEKYLPFAVEWYYKQPLKTGTFVSLYIAIVKCALRKIATKIL